MPGPSERLSSKMAVVTLECTVILKSALPTEEVSYLAMCMHDATILSYAIGVCMVWE